MFNLLRPNESVKQGDKHERLTAIGMPFRVRTEGGRRTLVVCECQCGSIRCITLPEFERNHSCGCYDREVAANRLRTHGLSDHPLYRVWSAMRQRCYLKSCKSYEDYGAKGVTVCDEWRASFEVFYNWAMSAGWQRGLEIDRLENDKGYSPDNCRIVTRLENARNKRKVRKLKAFGEEKFVSEWGDDPRCIVTAKILAGRIGIGWDAERAMTVPSCGKPRKNRLVSND